MRLLLCRLFVAVLIMLLFQGASDSEFVKTRLQLEAREQEMDRLESKMTTGAKLLADKDSRLRQLEFSLLDNTSVRVAMYLLFFTAELFNYH